MLWALSMGEPRAAAQNAAEEESVSTGEQASAMPEYPALTRGQIVVINAQRYVVTREPLPLAALEGAPPAPPLGAPRPPPLPYEGAIWVDGHWAYDATGFSWVAGRYVAPRTGHVFVPPRWAFLDGRSFYFNGFYVPYGVYVRSHFNRYYFSGMPPGGARTAHGPYWPVGAPGAAPASSTARARDPYWPVGAPR